MTDRDPHSGVHRLAVIGVGLMGGSLALAAQRGAGVIQIVGYDSDPTALAESLRMGVITEIAGSPAEAAAGADLAVVCTPVRSIPELVEQCVDASPRPRLVTDIGSTKSAIISSLSPLARSLFVGGHPICGAATAGVRYSRPDLFDGATYFLCTTGAALPELYALLQEFVSDLGARPVHIGAVPHDRIMAVISHLPHVLANVLMQQVGEYRVSGKRALHWVGPSFKDLTRVAGANPPMWRDIFMENREALADSLRAVAAELQGLSESLDRGDEARVAKSIDVAAAYHEELLEYEDLVPDTLYKVVARIPDQPGVLSKVMTTLGEANINIEDLTLHHISRSAGGDLVLFIAGEDVADSTSMLLESLGYPTVVSLTGDGGE